MPPKRVSRVPWSFGAPLVEVGFDSFIPEHFLQQLRSLPQSDESQNHISQPSPSDDRSTKRRKIESLPASSIPIAGGSVSFSRRCRENGSELRQTVHPDVGAHLYFNTQDGHLLLLSRSGANTGKLKVCISMREGDISQDVATIIEVAGKREVAQGAIWSDITLYLEQKGTMVTARFDFQLWWNETPTPFTILRASKERKSSKSLINHFFPCEDMLKNDFVRSAKDFYEAAYVPPNDDNVPLSIEVPGLQATLFPYQRRTLQWLLRRECVQWSETYAGLEPYQQDSDELSKLDTLRKVRDQEGNEVFVSDVFQTITRDPTSYRKIGLAVRGGVLAEEMGLGKTLEILGLILLHTRNDFTSTTLTGAGSDALPSGATLIVAPESLRAQWLSEIARHAPGLRVTYYEGCKKLMGQLDEELVSDLASFDVVVTTYSVLSAEIHFASEPPQRARRHERVYPRAKSPLVQISWWRVCLDEAQMIENGFSQAASVARIIPRTNSWGITGTPVRDSVKDLFGLLLFLRYEPYCYVPPAWEGLISESKASFQQLFRSISLRHTKAMVRDEIALPRQNRFVISMPFTAVEEQHYQSLFKEMAEACQLTTDGGPTVDDWEPRNHVEAMRTWLDRLRQTVLHPEVGVYNRRTLGQNRSRPMRTVEEVLDAMLDQSESAIRTEERTLLSTKLTRGQLFENSPRVKEALAIWEGVRSETAKLVSDARKRVREAAREHGAYPDQEDDTDMVSTGSEEDGLNSESRERVNEHQRRLRSALDLHHKAVFFCANAYFQISGDAEMTEPGSDEFLRLKKLEEEGYENAKSLRRELLQGSHGKVSRLMNGLAGKASSQSFTVIPELAIHGEVGIESGTIINGLEPLYEDLNSQADLLDDWREHLVQLLIRPLVDEEGEVETTGEELIDSTKIQEELMVYVQALRTVIADRHEAITGQTNELVKYETDNSLKLAKDGDGPAPETVIELFKKRDMMKPRDLVTTMRGAIGDLRSLQARLTRAMNDSNHEATPREVMELDIASKQLKATQQLLVEQSKAIMSMESEVESFTATMNARLEYYRQLQAVSDSVNPYDGPKTEEAISKLQQMEEDSWRKLSSAEAKHRYLLNLKEAGAKSNEPRMCVICQMPFVTGVLTVCGHQFCKECMMLWFKAHHNCPVCKRALKMSNLHDITIKPQQLQVHSDESRHEPTDSAEAKQTSRSEARKNTMIYSEFNSQKLEEIKNIELSGPSFTTKVDTLVRHLLWLRESDPGAKSIIFSQYKDFLGVLQNAFRRFRIGYASIDEHNGITKFKSDPAIECFLLHARAHSSGLNLVNANHVFLCEPLLNTALELQAIARVDRIGQRHETTVWLYLVSGTVEESIYNLSVQRRMDHMGKKAFKGKSKESTPELLDASIEAANTLEMEQATLSRLMSKDRSAGEVVDKGDLWQCLFGHVNKEAGQQPERDTRLQEQAVMSYLAGEAAEGRR